MNSMDSEQKTFLSLVCSPARCTAEQTAWLLGFQVHDVPILVSKGLLKPLGRPYPNATRYFAAAELQELRVDSRWLAKATDAVQDFWRQKNQGRTAPRPD